MAGSKIISLITGYENNGSDERGVKLGKSFFVRKYSGSLSEVARRFSSNAVFRLVSILTRRLTFTSSKTYGAAALSFGALTLLSYFIGELAGYEADGAVYALVAGLLFSVLSVPLLLTDEPLPVAIGRFKVTDYLFFDFLCIKRVSYSGNEGGLPIAVGIVVGGLPALLGMIFPLRYALLASLVVIFTYITMLSPEFAFFASIILIPYTSVIPHSYELLLLLVGLATLSFMRKALFGKRVLHIEQYDLLVILFMLLVFASGIAPGNIADLGKTGEVLILSLGYLLSSNIVTNRRLCDRTVSAIVLSSVPVAAVSAVTFFASLARGELDGSLSEGISSTFSSTDTLAAFLLVATVFSAILVKESRGIARAVYTLIMTLDLFALVLSGELFALFALILAVFAYFVMKLRHFSDLLIIGLSALPYAIFLLPESALDAVFDILPTNLSASETLRLWRECIISLGEHIFVGVGIGSDSFSDGISGFLDAENLFLGIAVEAGVSALVVFILLLIIRVRHRVNYSEYIKGSQIGTPEPLIETALFAMIVYGATDFIWSERYIYFLFLCVFGLGSATLRIAKKEHDDRILYYEDTKQHDSSAVDIQVRRHF